MTLPPLALPESLNYVAVFLTMGCNLNCSYCINDPTQDGTRNIKFPLKVHGKRKELTPGEWVLALNRIPYRPDLPLTLQGGEPTLYKGIGRIIGETPHYYDLLTNFALKPEAFAASLNGHQDKFRRDAPYPSIRVSYHPEEMNRTWEAGFEELVRRCEGLAAHGFDVSPVKAESDVGIYMVAHPDNVPPPATAYLGRVPFEMKEFLGVHDGTLYGTYKYPHSVDGELGTLECECRTSELLIDPLGFVWGCHFYLYESWVKCGMDTMFAKLQADDFHYTPQEKMSEDFLSLTLGITALRSG